MYPIEMNGSVREQASNGYNVSLFFNKLVLIKLEVMNIMHIINMFNVSIM